MVVDMQLIQLMSSANEFSIHIAALLTFSVMDEEADVISEETVNGLRLNCSNLDESSISKQTMSVFSRLLRSKPRSLTSLCTYICPEGRTEGPQKESSSDTKSAQVRWLIKLSHLKSKVLQGPFTSAAEIQQYVTIQLI